MLSRSDLVAMGQRLSSVLVERLSGLPNFEALADALMADINRVFAERQRPDGREHEPEPRKTADVLPWPPDTVRRSQ